jgi:aminopeptidase N
MWWPNKDHLSDEPDSMHIRVDAPNDLTCVANGQLASRYRLDEQYTQWTYKVSYPINNYNVTLNIADYAYFSDMFEFRDGDKLRLKYFVLSHNLDKARRQFGQVKDMFACLENLYGKYPFMLDGFTLVETPYLGMEHQSAVAYGNQFKNNSFGFDYIIIHESGHEYWGNSVSAGDMGELWIHEALTMYTDALFVECKFGHDVSQAYLDSLKALIRNNKPIIGPLGVNYQDWDDNDLYFKGAWMLHSIRSLIHDDILWFDILEGMYNEFKYSIVETEDIVGFINKRTSFDLMPIFNQYLKHANPPKFVYWIEHTGKKSILHYKWTVDERDFQMPIRMKLNKNEAFTTLFPSTDFQIKTFEIKDLERIWLDHQSFYFVEEHMKGDNF